METVFGEVEEKMKQAVGEEMLRRMEREAVCEMLHYHEKNGKQKLKDAVKKAAGRYVPPKDFIFWPTAVIANSFTEWGMMDGRREVLAVLEEYFGRWIDAGMPIFYVDDVLSGVSLVDLYEATKAEKYKTGADKMAEYLFGLSEKESDRAGSIPYRPAQKNGYIFADGVGMTASFLIKYGTFFGDIRSVELGLLQLKNMFLFGIDEKTGLPYHGFQFESKEKYGIIGWGRAVGWLLMALARACVCLEKYMDKCGKEKQAKKGQAETEETNSESEALAEVCAKGFAECSRAYGQLLGAVRPYQKENGAFAWQLEALEGPEDSSATAMIAYGVLMGNGQGAEELVKHAAEYLAGCEKDGKVYHCLTECMGFAQYPQEYGAYPWALGPALGVLERQEFFHELSGPAPYA